MDIHARVDKSDIGRIKKGQKSTFTVDAHPGRQFKAEVTAVRKAPQQPGTSSILRRAPQQSSNVITYTVVLRTANHGMLLLPGMTAVLKIVVDEVTDVLTVPMAALRYTPQRNATRGVPGLAQVRRCGCGTMHGAACAPCKSSLGLPTASAPPW